MFTHSTCQVARILKVDSDRIIQVNERGWNGKGWVRKYPTTEIRGNHFYKTKQLESLNRDICKFYKKGENLDTGRYLRGRKIKGFDGDLLCLEF